MNVMILRQSYEKREITEIKWIHESNNLVDSMTKIKSSLALKTVIDICWFISTVMIRFKSVYCMSVVYWLNDVRVIDQAIYWVIYM
jgi:hypothetical protein